MLKSLRSYSLIQQTEDKKLNRKKGKFGILAKLLVFIIPIVIVGINIVAYTSGQMASDAILAEVNEHMESELTANINDVDGKLQEIRGTAATLSSVVGETYKNTVIDTYAKIFKAVVKDNDLILGSGIWFELNTYRADPAYLFQEYVGPYWYKDGSNIVEDWEYSNAEYDYINQEYYLNAKAQPDNSAVITEPYYDPSTGIIMASCSSAVYNQMNEYIGCITVDMSLDTISDMVGSIKIGKAGYAVMIAPDGTYIYTSDISKVENGMKITEETNGLAAAAGTILASESGKAEYVSGKEKYHVYFASVPDVNWKLLLILPDTQINEASTRMLGTTLPLSIAVMIACAVAVVILARRIAKPLKGVTEFAGELATGNFTIEELPVKSSDEVGEVGRSLNEMYRNNKEIITNISEESGNINDAASTLSAMSEELSAEFAHIRDNMTSVNEAMMNSSAATEEVSASVTEVNNSVNRLAEETDKITEEVRVITERAGQVQKESREAHDSAINIANEREQELNAARAKATVVKEIENLANVINDIASEIDLLSLNASIEAARAGEAGRGFAVVAQQINKLATETATAVHQIQETVTDIQDAFADLGESSEKLLNFVTETATPDYSKFTEIGRQYGEDANLFGELSDKIAEMIQSIKMTMDEVNMAVQNIAGSTEETASRSADVTESVNSATQAIDSIAEQATNQQLTASNLSDIVNKFKLK